jgi:hypothetical protein
MHKVLLPGCNTLERYIARLREPGRGKTVSDHLRTYFLNIRRDGFCGLLQFES